MTTDTVIGYIAAALTTLSFLPQVIKTWKTRSTRDISLAMFIAFCAGVFLWAVYGVLIMSWPVIIANSVVLVLGGIMLVLKIKHG
jgi:MtN3 and saliva related transmembrane protein